MSKINIEGKSDIDDSFYRYKMRKMIIESQKNKTVITNLKEVGDDINRNPETIAMFFKKKMSISISYKKNLFVTTAVLDYKQMHSLLREFIEMFVLCNKCQLPEINIIVEKKKIEGVCQSCSNVIDYTNEKIVPSKILKSIAGTL